VGGDRAVAAAGAGRWRDLPERHGPWKTAHERLRLWTKDGAWAKILDHVIVASWLRANPGEEDAGR
jgi:transposase